MFSHEQNLRCTERWVEKLVGQGKLPASALEALKQRAIPTTTINTKPIAEMVPQYVKGPIPGPALLMGMTLSVGSFGGSSLYQYLTGACCLLLIPCDAVLYSCARTHQLPARPQPLPAITVYGPRQARPCMQPSL